MAGMTPMGRRTGGWRLPALAAAILMALALVGQAREAGAQTAPPPPDSHETARLVWSTLIAIDHANRTGNYTVLRELAAPGFRNANDAARLAAIFAKIRERDIGLRRVVLATPVYSEPPQILENGLFRARGSFPSRPVGINFDMLFQYTDRGWLLFGVAVAPAAMPEPPPVGLVDGNAEQPGG